MTLTGTTKSVHEELKRLREENAELRGSLQGTLSLIRKAQERLCSYLEPDGNDDDRECLNDLLYMFDGPEQRAIETPARALLNRKG